MQSNRRGTSFYYVRVSTIVKETDSSLELETSKTDSVYSVPFFLREMNRLRTAIANMLVASEISNAYPTGGAPCSTRYIGENHCNAVFDSQVYDGRCV